MQHFIGNNIPFVKLDYVLSGLVDSVRLQARLKEKILSSHSVAIYSTSDKVMFVHAHHLLEYFNSKDIQSENLDPHRLEHIKKKISDMYSCDNFDTTKSSATNNDIKLLSVLLETYRTFKSSDIYFCKRIRDDIDEQYDKITESIPKRQKPRTTDCMVAQFGEK